MTDINFLVKFTKVGKSAGYFHLFAFTFLKGENPTPYKGYKSLGSAFSAFELVAWETAAVSAAQGVDTFRIFWTYLLTSGTFIDVGAVHKDSWRHAVIIIRLKTPPAQTIVTPCAVNTNCIGIDTGAGIL